MLFCEPNLSQCKPDLSRCCASKPPPTPPPPIESYNCISGNCIDPGDGSGTYSTFLECATICSYTCACDPMPTAWSITVGSIVDGTYTGCAAVNGTWLLNDFYDPSQTFDGSCAWYGPAIPDGPGYSLYWGVFNTPGNPNGDWGIQLQLWDDSINLQVAVWLGLVNITVSGFDCNDPIVFSFVSGNPYSITTSNCNNWPTTITATPVF